MTSKRVLTANLPKTPVTSIVSNDLEIRQLLTRSCEGKTFTTLKIRGSETLLRTRLIDCNPVKEGIQLALSESLTLEALAKEMEAHHSKECMVLIYLEGRSIVGFNAVPSEIQKDRLVFDAPDRLFKIQRRKDVRFIVPSGYEYILEMDSIEQTGVRVKKRIVDISEGGLSFFVLSPREAGLFQTGLVISKCVILMNNQRLNVTIKVLSQGVLDRGPKGTGHKIGAIFEAISAEDKKYIGQFIYSQASHLFY